MIARCLLLGSAAAAIILAAPARARACGGFFCSSANLPVNQAAEKIIFADNGDGTVTAVIQILYQGPAPKFSWLLPIASVPKAEQIGVASNIAFQRLQAATNPQYTLTVRVEGTCGADSQFPTASPGASFGGNAGSTDNGSPQKDLGVTLEASGTAGAFEFSVISVDGTVGDPSELAVNWLTTNGYTVGDGAPGLIRPYLQAGLHLLALRLIKGADTGSIRPIRLTTTGEHPMIPIKLTAVAANADMGVMTWLSASARGVPQNYLHLDLNEARINWFNANSNYNDVVTAAADEAAGQGFVTEFAGPSTALANVVWTSSDEAQWQNAQRTVYSSFAGIFAAVYNQWGQWDGFWDAMRKAVTLPAGVAFADFQICPNCYAEKSQFTPSALFAELQTNVIAPVKDVQALLDRNGYVSRLYTTMSPAEMTVDPVFTFNPSLEDVSNVHTAERVIECSPAVTQSNAPWRIALPQGGIVRGAANQLGSWPAALDTQASTSRLVRLSASGEGAVVQDNSAAIKTALDAYNATVPGEITGPSGGCSTAPGSRSAAGWFLAALVGLASARRRRC